MEQAQIPNIIKGQVSEPLAYDLILHWDPMGPGENNCKSIRKRDKHKGAEKENAKGRAREKRLRQRKISASI